MINASTSSGLPRYRPVSLGGSTHARLSTLADGSQVIASTEALESYPRRLTDKLLHWAAQTPDRVFAAERNGAGGWRTITYADMLRRVRRIAQSLLGRGLSAERPIVILSGNDLEHLQLTLGAMWAGVPVCPVSPGFSLLSSDFDKLRHVFDVITPGLVFAADAAGYGRAIAALVPADVEVVLTRSALEGRETIAFETLLALEPGPEADAAHAAVSPETIAKFLFTSGSTSLPKAVTTTQRMLCANQQMILQCLRFLGEEPPVLLDWLPWHHTFGGSHNVGIVLYNGGTLYIDDGKPTAQAFARTVSNLRDVAPTVYFSVPKGWEDLATALERDADLGRTFFSRIKLLFYSGAGLSQAVWDRLDRIAETCAGERIRMITGLGMTETSPSSLFTTGDEVRSGYVGLPAPGCEVKLTADGEKLEARFRGPHVMPGYWRDPGQSAKVFDADGFYRTGDALKLIDPENLDRGLLFDGRVSEDFKLSTGTFVSVGPLVQRVILAGAPYVLDVVVAGINRNEIGLLIFPRLDSCRTLAATGSDLDGPAILAAPPVRAYFQALIDRLAAAASTSSLRIARACLLRDPPSFAKGEITDKGSINQRAVLAQRAALIEALYAGSHADLILPRPPG
jgi:feruloyl-CoA synthase